LSAAFLVNMYYIISPFSSFLKLNSKWLSIFLLRVLNRIILPKNLNQIVPYIILLLLQLDISLHDSFFDAVLEFKDLLEFIFDSLVNGLDLLMLSINSADQVIKLFNIFTIAIPLFILGWWEYEASVLFKFGKDCSEHKSLVVKISFVLIANDNLKIAVGDPFVCGHNDSNHEVEHNNL